MKSLEKKRKVSKLWGLVTYPLFIAAVVGIYFYAWVPGAEIYNRGAKYDAVTKGMSQQEIVNKMGDPDSRIGGAKKGLYWDKDYLTGNEAGPISNSIQYTTTSPFVSVTFEFSFNRRGKAVAKYRYE